MSIKFDTDGFARAVKDYQKATKKSIPDILNHAATQAAFRGQQARFTPKAKLTGALGSPANPDKPRKRWSKAKPYGTPGLDRLYFALAAKNGTPGRAAASKIYRRRRSSVGFTRVNWGAVINKLGLKRSHRVPQNPDILFTRATIHRALVTIYNAKLDGRGEGAARSTLEPGWRRAVHDAVYGPRGMVAFAHEKIRKNWKR